MSVIDEGKIPFRPYARLISILGDQLISSKWIAIIELVKNSYDADAEEVTVRFLNFDDNPKTIPTIEIEDDGDGMSLDTVLNVWMKPATPNKLYKKKSKSKSKRFTTKGRLVQGDKGVGRFAVYKLGKNIQLFTKRIDSQEVNLELNFAKYELTGFDEDNENSSGDEKDLLKAGGSDGKKGLLKAGETEKSKNITLSKSIKRDSKSENTAISKSIEEDPLSENKDLFLDEIENSWSLNSPPKEIKNKKKKGTLIRISNLHDDWKESELEKLHNAFQRMRWSNKSG